jgi:PDDEXK-like domain of unknown function (DUF3799)
MSVAPGLYTRGEITFEAYKLIDAVNQSTLKAIAKSPLHYQYRLEHAVEETQPMRLGSVAHCACLELAQLTERYRVWVPPPDKKTGKPKKDDFRGSEYDQFAELAALEGKTVVKQREIDTAMRIREALWSNQLAARYLKRGIPEVVMVWRDAVTGILCKARLDWLSLSVADVIVELKTARDVGQWAFSSAFAKAGYDVQAAFYHDGYTALTGRTPGGKCIAIENVEPHDTVVYDMNEVIDPGREIYRGYLERLVECRKSGEWLGQAETAEQILRLPKWRDPFDDESDPFAGMEAEAVSP